MGVVSELRRRNVFRVALAYILVAWLILQVGDTLAPALRLPDWVNTVLAFFLILGFPLAIFFAWAYELTPEGLKREQNVDRSKSITAATARKLDRSVIAMLVIAIVYLVVDNYVLTGKTIEVAAVDRSIAVLPFRNRSNVAEDAFFVDGMHDDLLTQLARLESFDKVISRTSVERYRDTTESIPEIGKELGVAAILEGGVQRAGDQVRINVQLIDAMTDEHVWAQTYDRELTVENLFEIQSQVTREIVSALHGVLSEAEDLALRKYPTTSMEAYANYVLGRQELSKRTSESILLAKGYFEKAIQLDPEYALAYVGLADAYALYQQYRGIDWRETLDARTAAIDNALRIDPAAGEAYANLANLQIVQGHLEESEQNFLRAIQLSPNYATSYHWYSALLQRMDRFKEAELQIRKALDLNPQAPVLVTNLGAILWRLGRRDEAESVLIAGIRKNPDFPGLYRTLGSWYWISGRLGEALILQKVALELDSTRRYRERECRLYLDLGDDKEAEECLNSLQEEYPDRVLVGFSSLSYFRSQFEESFNQLDQYVQQLPYPDGRKRLASGYVVIGKYKEARSILEPLEPDLFGASDISTTESNWNDMITAAIILSDAGETSRADYLFDSVLQSIRSAEVSGTYVDGLFKVAVEIGRGDKENAIEALRDAVNSGWRRGWWMLRGPRFESMREDPRWVAIMDELEADVARQRAWFDEHKDDELFEKRL